MVSSNSSRDAIRDEIIATAEKYYTGFDTMTSVDEYTSTVYDGLKSKVFEREDGMRVTVSKGKIPGHSLEKHKNFRMNLIQMTKKISENIEITEMPDTDGLRTYYNEVKMPMFMSNRTFINM